MRTLIDLCDSWVRTLASLSWQVGVLIFAVAALTLLLRRARPSIRHALWCVVLVRLCIVGTITSPVAASLFAAPDLQTSVPESPMPSTGTGKHETVSSTPAGVPEMGITDSREAPLEAARSTGNRLPQVTLWAWLCLVWLVGALWLFAIIVSRSFRLYRIARKSFRAERPELITLLEELRGRMGIRRAVRLKALPQHLRGIGPCATGLIHPVILLPPQMVTGWQPSTLEPILLHELAHIRRWDVLVQFVQLLTQIIYWFHPLVWFAHARLRHERELICDDIAIAYSGRTSRDYGVSLVQTLEECRLTASWHLMSVGIGESRLMTRMRRLLDSKYRVPKPLGRAALAFILTFGAIGVLVASSKAPAQAVENKYDEKAAAAERETRIAEKTDTPRQAPAQLKPAEVRRRVIRRAGEEQDPHALPVEAGENPGELSGRVVDQQGNPIAGVLVDVWHWHAGNETRTAADGSFVLKNLSRNSRVEVRFIKEGYAPYTIARQPVGNLTTPLSLDQTTFYEGVVTGPDGKPVPNASIRANQGPKQADGVLISEIWTETRTDSEGRYRLLLQEDTYDIQVTAAPDMVARLRQQSIQFGTANQLDIALTPGVTFRARVVDSQTGKGVPYVTLKNWQHPGVNGVTDAEGNVEMKGLLPGPFEFDVKVQGYSRWWSAECSETHAQRKIEQGGWQRNFDSLPFELEVGMSPVTITVEKSVRIRGKVIAPDGTPVAGATVDPARTGSGNSLTGDTRLNVRTKEDGSFELLIPASNEAEYNLVAHDGKYREWRTWANGVADPIRTTPGQEIDATVIQLTRPGTVRGRVVDEAGRPIADREVRAHAVDKLENRYYDSTVRTDREGRFELKFLRPAKHYIQAAPFWLQAEKAPNGSSLEVEVTEGQALEIADLVTQANR